MGISISPETFDDDLPDFHPSTVLRDWGTNTRGSGEIFENFRIADALTGVISFGATGSGKTSGPAKHLALAYLAADFAILVLCAKKEERRQWEEWAESVGRWNRATQTGDIRIIDANGKWRFNPLDWEAERPGEGGGLSLNIVSLLDEIAGGLAKGAGKVENSGGDNKWFDDALHYLNMNLVELPLFAGLRVTLPLLRSILNTAAQSLDDLKSDRYQKGDCAAVLRAAAEATADADDDTRADFEECRSYWETEWPTLSDKTRSIIQLSFSMLVRPLLTRPLRRLFCADTNLTPEDAFAGKIIIVDLAVQEFRRAGRVANLIWKYCMQVAILRRSPPENGTYLRPVAIWADECQNFVTAFDAEYQAVARSAGGCTVYLTQTREALRRVLGDADSVDALVANLQAKFFCQNTGETNEWASKFVFGEHWQEVATTSTNSDHVSGSLSGGTSVSQQLRRYVDPSWFAQLKRGGGKYKYQIECIAYNGGTLYAPPDGKGRPVPFKVLTFNQINQI